MAGRVNVSLPPTHVYIGRAPCGCVYMLRNDDHDKDTAHDVAEVIKEGGSVERVTWKRYIDVVRNEDTFMACPHQDEQMEMEL